MILSDESHFCLSSDRPQHCLQGKEERMLPEYVQGKTKQKPGIMMWAYFNSNMVGRIVRISAGIKINAAST